MKIYSISNFEICNSVLLAIVTILYITLLGLTYFITGSLYLFTAFTYFAHLLPLPLAVTSLFCFYYLDFLRFRIWVRAHGTVFIILWLILLMFSGLAMPARFLSFTWLNDIPVCVCICVSCFLKNPFIHQWTQVFFTLYILCLCVSCSVVSDSVTPWTVACQAPLSMGFSRQEHCRGLPFAPSGDLPDPGIEPGSPTLQTDSLLSELPGKPLIVALF